MLKVLATALVIYLGNAAAVIADSAPCVEPSLSIGRFRRTEVVPAIDTVVLVPGLNNAPLSLNALAELLLDHGHHVLEVVLAGHAEDRRPVTLEQWVCDVVAAARFANAQFPGLGISIVGFSLGGTIAVQALDESEDLSLRRLVLLAPAVGLRTRGYLLRPFLWLRFFGVTLPSLTPEAFRYAPRTPLSSYHQLFRAVDATTELQNAARLNKIPTWLAIHEADEAVSPSRLRRWLKSQALDWPLTVVPTDRGGPAPHHLIADRHHLDSLGLVPELLTQLGR